MLGPTVVRLAGLLATCLAHDPPGTDQNHNRKEHRRSAPDIEAIMSVPPATFESYTAGNLVRGDTTVVIEGEVGPAAAAVGRRWTCSSAPSFT